MMSLVSEYRRLAAASLDLAKRAAVLSDKTRLLVIAEAWLDLADRVAKKSGPAKRRTGGSIEDLTSAESGFVRHTIGGDEEPTTRDNSTSPGAFVRGNDGSTPACK